MADKKDRKGFSFQPDVISANRSGEHQINKKLSNPYVMLQSQTQGKLFYTPKDNKYWIAPGVECTQDRFEEKYLAYLRWDFDEIIEEVVEKEDSKGKTVSLKTGRAISTFPPTPENIAAKRKELLDAAVASGDDIDQEEILSKTSPTQLLNNDLFESMLDKTSADEKLARRLNSQSRY
jgi:hypothetical protein